MYVRDVDPDRWQRSMRFVRTLAGSLQWTERDRMAIAVFAHIAAPQVRLTTDPNTVFFFLDHLSARSPFPLEDVTTWNTNIELGIAWGLRLVERDEELNGPSPNGKVLVLISDGRAWSGELARSVALAQARRIPVFVVGVGTPTGDFIPEAAVSPDGAAPAARMSPIRATLDRDSLRDIAAAAGGGYFELDRQSDRQIAVADRRWQAPGGRSWRRKPGGGAVRGVPAGGRVPAVPRDPAAPGVVRSLGAGRRRSGDTRCAVVADSVTGGAGRGDDLGSGAA
ncbi:MAG: VWA domain-containing protein [Acidobacteria bacterium]|nr:VWA domain-containing protein [Acidobacteriota bacterium]